MFNIKRPADAPDCTKATGYNTDQIVNILLKIFHGKCYLCERGSISDPEIEHFVPHEGDNKKKYDWLNLYLACARCNSIKSNSLEPLLDCSDDSIDVRKAIRHYTPPAPDLDVMVSAVDDADSVAVSTANLLSKCFNATNTPLRAISRSALIEDLLSHQGDFYKYRSTVTDIRSTPKEVQQALEKLEVMISTEFPYSVFWRWHVMSDSLLRAKAPGLAALIQ